MKKIVFFNIPMKYIPDHNCLDFSNTGNVKSSCKEKIYFGLNALLYDKLTAEDDVKIVLIWTNSGNEKQKETSLLNIEKFKKEFETVCNGKFQSVTYETLEGGFSETKNDIEKLYRALLGTLEQECQIIADTTFGPRMNLMITMNALNFAERFFDAEIISVLNVKVLFDSNNVPIPGSQELYDVSPFYYLNNLTYAIKAKDGNQALKMLDNFFNL